MSVLARRIPQFDPSKYRYVGKLNRPAGSGNIKCLWFKPDGTRLFWIDLGTSLLRSIDLNTPWSLTGVTSNIRASAVALLRSDGITTISNPSGLALSDDGTSVFVSDIAGARILKYTLSTAWDPSSITNTAQATAIQDVSFLQASGGGNSLYLDPSGTRLYSSAGLVRQFSMSNLDLSTLSLIDGKSLVSDIFGVSIADDGKKLIVCSYIPGVVISYELSTPYNVSTATQYKFSKTVGGTGFPLAVNQAFDMYLANDGINFYVIEGTVGAFHQWNINITI